MVKRSVLAEKLAQVRERIAAAAAKAKREPSEITLVAVTKAAAPDQIREILNLGVSDIAESRVQVLIQRAAQLQEFYQRRAMYGEGPAPAKIRWHMIGHLQRNKVKPVLPAVHMIQSIDSLRLAEEVDSQAAKINRRIPVLLEVNASEESAKTGVAVGAAIHLAEQIDSMENMHIMGLMTMAPLEAPEEKIRRVFARTRELFEEVRWHKIGGTALRHLSMGMSNDFEWAIAEGATMVRIGSALFGTKIVEAESSLE